MTGQQRNRGALNGTVAVVGGGVVGFFVAYRLAAMGVAVTLLERDGPGSGATGNSAGNARRRFLA